MNNKNRKLTKNNFLTKEVLLQKEQMLAQIEEEIQQLKYYIDNSKSLNKKINFLRRINISLKIGQLVAPYVLTAGLSFGLFTSLGITPFIRDDCKKQLEMRKEIDSLGNIKCEEQYDSYNKKEKNTLSYVGRWEEDSNGLFSREVKTFSTDKVEEKIVTAIINDVDISSLENVFGKPISILTQSQNNLSDEEIATEPYIKAVLYSNIKGKYVIVKETIYSNIGYTIIWLLFTLFFENLPTYYRSRNSSFDFERSIRKINEKYPLIDSNELLKKLEIKKSNYDRLMR